MGGLCFIGFSSFNCFARVNGVDNGCIGDIAELDDADALDRILQANQSELLSWQG